MRTIGMRRLVLTVILAGVSASLAGCGPSQPALRLRAEVGRGLVYEVRRTDDWPDPVFGHGGVLETAVRLRLETTDAVFERGGSYQTVVEAVQVTSAPRFGVLIDTDTPTPAREDPDPLQVEIFARSLLGRPGNLTIHANGSAGAVEPDRELRSELSRWARDKGQADKDERRRATRVAMLLDQLVDGPRVAARALQSPGLLLPRDAYPEAGATWTREAPPSPSPAGLLACTIDVAYERRADGVVVLTGKGAFTCPKALPDAKLAFVSGTFSAEAEFDTERGVFIRYEEHSEMVFTHVADVAEIRGEETRAKWHRVLTLVE